jgi:isopenicillin-N N-acyltransferase like protein
MSELLVVECRGTPHERGVAHGQQLRDQVHEAHSAFTARVTSDFGTTERDLVELVTSYLPASRAYAPELVAEIEGIAEGSGLPFESIFFLNCHDELACHGPSILARGMPGCTAFAASVGATVDGHAYIGQGWDYYDDLPVVLLRLSGDDTPTMLVLSMPGVAGGPGINQHGLAMVWNTLKANDAGAGVPAPFVLRKGLQATNLADLVRDVVCSQRANGMNFIAADAQAAVDIELSATRFHVTYCEGVLGHANHYEAPPLLGFEADLPTALPDTLLRAGRMRVLLNERCGAIDLAALKEIMTDHCSGPGSICRHSFADLSTMSSIICDTAALTMWATNGNPCTEAFVSYSVE